MNILVCGATGYLGGYVCTAMKDAGHHVRALARNKAKFMDGEVGKAVDEVFEGEAMDDSTLDGLADGCDVAFSSIGLRSSSRSPTFWQVDYQANINLVKRCREAGVKHFIFTSVFKGDEIRAEGGVAEARELVCDELVAHKEEMRYTLVRPVGFFNDAAEFFSMAADGRGWVIGDGDSKINFIHGADIAAEVVKCLTDESLWNAALPIGGPDTYTWREVYEIAFSALEKPVKISSVPVWLLKTAAWLIKPFNSNVATLITAMAILSADDCVAPSVGTHHLGDFYKELADK